MTRLMLRGLVVLVALVRQSGRQRREHDRRPRAIAQASVVDGAREILPASETRPQPVAVPEPELPQASAPEAGDLAGRVAGSAASLAGRRVGLMALSGVTAAVITRLLGPGDYGVYGAAIATWTLIGGIADFGFSMAVARDLPHADGSGRPMVRAAYAVGLRWSCALALVAAAAAALAGPTSPRGLTLLVLAPSLPFYGLAAARSVFLARYETGAMVRVDLVVAVLQTMGMIGAATLGLGPPGVAGAVSVSTALNFALVARLARRHLAGDATAPFGRRRFARRAVPLGVLAVMTQTYATIDLVLIGFILEGPTVGEYAAAARILAILTGVTGLITAAALPAFSALGSRRTELQAMVARVWHWLIVAAVPLFAGLGLFAGPAVAVVAGSGYDGAVSVLRVLAIAGLLMVVNNLLGAVMVATGQIRTLYVQNTVAIVLNVAANVALLPRYGVQAAAWATVATEAVITVGAVIATGGRLGYASCVRVSLRPLAAIVAAAAATVALREHQAMALAVAPLVLVGGLTATRAWPPEVVQRWRLARSGARNCEVDGGTARVRAVWPPTSEPSGPVDGGSPTMPGVAWQPVRPTMDPFEGQEPVASLPYLVEEPPRRPVRTLVTWLGLLIVPFVIAAGVYAASGRLTPSFQATSTVRITAQGQNGASDQAVGASNDLASQYAQLVDVGPVKRIAARRLHVPASTLDGHVSGGTVAAQNLLTVTASSTTGPEAVARARALTSAFRSYTHKLAGEQAAAYTRDVKRQLAPLDKRIDEVRGQLTLGDVDAQHATAQLYANLITQRQQATAAAATAAVALQPGVQVVSMATSAAKASPKPKLYALIGFVASLLIVSRIGVLIGRRRGQRRVVHPPGPHQPAP